MQRIMLATDFSARADRALRRAVLIARAQGAALDLVHVVDDDRPAAIVDQEVAMARGLLDHLAATLMAEDGITASVQVILSDPFAGVVAAAGQGAPDLLVIGPHRRQVLRDVFLGTTAERVIRSVACPVLMVNGPPVGPWRHVLLATDLTDGSRDALRRVATLNLAGEARVTALHVFTAPALRLTAAATLRPQDRARLLDDQHIAARAALAAFMAALGPAGDGLNAAQVVRFAQVPTAHAVLEAATDLAADLIVVATHAKGGVERLFLGSVAAEVLQSAAVDVLAIPPGRA